MALVGPVVRVYVHVVLSSVRTPNLPGRPALTILALRRHPVLALVGAVFVGIGTAFVLLPWLTYARDAALAERGARAEATVVQLRGDPTPGEVGGAQELEFEYAFRLPDGRQASGWTVGVSREDYRSLSEGDAVRVVYDPGDPTHSFTVGNGLDSDGGESALEAALFSLFGLAFVGFGGLFAWGLLVRLPGRWSRLLREGARATGTVMGVERSGERRARLHYAFSDRFGTSHEAQTEWGPVTLADGWSVGDPGEVRYDTRDAGQSVWLGRGDFDFYR